MEVPILKQGEFLIATIQAALSDADLEHLRLALVQRVVRFRSRAVIVDVTAMDVMWKHIRGGSVMWTTTDMSLIRGG